MRATLAACVCMLAGPLHALINVGARPALCRMQCADAAGVYWVMPCFVARDNFRTRGGGCVVRALDAE